MVKKAGKTKPQYVVKRTVGGILPVVKKSNLNAAIKVAKIYAMRNWSDGIKPKYGKIRISLGRNTVKLYGYYTEFPFRLRIYK